MAGRINWGGCLGVGFAEGATFSASWCHCRSCTCLLVRESLYLMCFPFIFMLVLWHIFTTEQRNNFGMLLELKYQISFRGAYMKASLSVHELITDNHRDCINLPDILELRLHNASHSRSTSQWLPHLRLDDRRDACYSRVR